jgi:hypothetical protein
MREAMTQQAANGQAQHPQVPVYPYPYPPPPAPHGNGGGRMGDIFKMGIPIGTAATIVYVAWQLGGIWAALQTDIKTNKEAVVELRREVGEIKDGMGGMKQQLNELSRRWGPVEVTRAK